MDLGAESLYVRGFIPEDTDITQAAGRSQGKERWDLGPWPPVKTTVLSQREMGSGHFGQRSDLEPEGHCSGSHTVVLSPPSTKPGRLFVTSRSTSTFPSGIRSPSAFGLDLPPRAPALLTWILKGTDFGARGSWSGPLFCYGPTSRSLGFLVCKTAMKMPNL